MMKIKSNTASYKKYQVIISMVLCLVLTVLTMYPVPVAYAEEKVDENDPRVQELRDKVSSLDDEIAASKAKQAKLEKEIGAASVSASGLQSQVNELQTQISAYNEKIDTLNSQVSALNAQLQSTEKSIAETEENIEEQQNSIAETQKLLGERMRAMYMSGNVSTIELILEADSFENLLVRLELLAQVAKHDNKIVEDLENKIADLEAMKNSLEQKKAQLESDKEEIESSKTAIEATRNELKSQKSLLDSKLSALEKYISQLDADSVELNAYRKTIQAQQDAYMDKIYEMVNGISSTGSGNVTGMIWPVPYNNSYISSGFGKRNFGNGYHLGIDITMPGASDYNKRIVASADGVVRVASNICSHNWRKNTNCGCNHGYGNYVLIDHGDGLVAYYGHLTRASVHAGQKVSKGDQIGIMGCTGYSTGAHLHFEIRVNGGKGDREVTARNPLNYVSKP